MKAPYLIKLLILLSLIPRYSFSQSQDFEIFGTINGKYNSKMYLFFEGDYKHKDSLSSEIRDGKFYFKGQSPLPILARLHMDQTSLIADFYIDSSVTRVNCTSYIQTEKKNKSDSLNLLTITSVTGSHTDEVRANYEKRFPPRYAITYMHVLKKREYEWLLQTIKQNPKSKVSPYLLSNASSLNYIQASELNSLIDTSLQNSFEGRSVKHLLTKLQKAPNTAIGAPFHEFILKDTSGIDVDSRRFRGKYTLIVFWASWCGPCRAEHPELNALYAKYKDKGLQMVGISIDKDTIKWKEAIVKDELHWTHQVIESLMYDGDLIQFYQIEGIPTSILVDKEGKIVSFDPSLKQMEALIRKER